jgi:hypothetical protein
MRGVPTSAPEDVGYHSIVSVVPEPFCSSFCYFVVYESTKRVQQGSRVRFMGVWLPAGVRMFVVGLSPFCFSQALPPRLLTTTPQSVRISRWYQTLHLLRSYAQQAGQALVEEFAMLWVAMQLSPQ